MGLFWRVGPKTGATTGAAGTGLKAWTSTATGTGLTRWAGRAVSVSASDTFLGEVDPVLVPSKLCFSAALALGQPLSASQRPLRAQLSSLAKGLGT